MYLVRLCGIVLMASGILLVSTASSSQADFIGFGDFSHFDINQSDSSSAPLLGNNSIRLTSTTSSQSRSIFHKSKHSFSRFQASFQYRAVGTPASGTFGAAFVLQNDLRGSKAYAAHSVSGVPTKFGYSDFFGGIRPSIALTLEYGTVSTGSSSAGLYTNGVRGGSEPITTLDIFSGNLIDFEINYDGSTLTQTITDTVTLASVTLPYRIDLGDFINSDTAYVGLTAASGQGTFQQHFYNLTYSVPEASSFVMLAGVCGIGAVGHAIRRRHQKVGPAGK